MSLNQIFTSYRTIYLMNHEFPESDPDADGSFWGRVIWPYPGGALVMTGTHTGLVTVDAQGRREPREIDIDDWDTVAQIVLPDPPSHLYVTGPDSEEMSDDLIVAPGPVVVRVAARGRDFMYVEENGPNAEERYEPRESWLIDVWPKRPQDKEEMLRPPNARPF